VLTRAAAQEITITDEHLLERLATVDVIVFEKTGAFTRGTPEITDVLPYGKKITAGHVLAYAAAAEKHLPHPLANALVQAAERKGINLPERDAVEHRIGLGVESTVEGATVLVGSQRFLTQKGVRLQRTRKDVRAIRTQTGQIVSPLFVARDGKLIGLLIFTDPLRPEADVAISTLRAEGKQEIVLLTGDHPDTAEQVAKQLGISRTLADAIPEQKAEFIRLLQQGGHTVAVVGDGITTSPILAHADVGIIIRGGGENLQNGVSGALVECDLRQLPQTISLAQESVDLRRQNSNLIFYTNAVAAALALPGLISLNVASVLSLGSVFLATVNALRPLGNRAVLSSASQSLSFALRHTSKHETKHEEKKSRSEC
jgi:P-type E1-E2 ATPase